jgi:uncharacterized peroxidase-related enzyme
LAHAHDLRAEVDDDYDFSREEEGDEFVHTFVKDWRILPLTEKLVALLEFAEKLTDSPAKMGQEDIDILRRAGWSEVAIHDAVHVISYFNYINRVADALGVENETFVRNWGQP